MKKFFIICLTLICFVSLGVDAWYLYVLKFAPEKVVSQTFNVGKQKITNADGSETSRDFIEVNVFDDVFEMKFNYMLDESQTAFYSQGIQYVSKSDSLDFTGNYKKTVSSLYSGTEKSGKGMRKDYIDYYDNILTNKKYNNLDIYNYQSSDNYVTTTLSTNEINEDTMFKIQIGNEIFGMKFKYDDIYYRDGDTKVFNSKFHLATERTYLGSDVFAWWGRDNYREDNYYRASDLSYFMELVYNAVKIIPAGTDKVITFEFGDLFNYYDFDEETNTYSEESVSTDKASNIVANVKSYYNIKVRKYEGKLKSSTQSLFHCYAGKYNYNVEQSFDDYFIGRTLISLSEDDFDFISTNSINEYEFKLSDKFIDWYDDYKSMIMLDITLDLDNLELQNINFVGFTNDAFKDFVVYKVKTIENGIISEVDYE